MNTIEVYRDTGSKAGKAARKRDYMLTNFHNQWLSRALALEKPEDRTTCREAYNSAYREETR